MSQETHLAREIRTQPSDWVAVAKRAPEWQSILPQPGERVLVTGCGTSYYMATAYAALRQAAGQGETRAVPASEVLPGETEGYDQLLAISRSGTTTEVVELLTSVRDRLATVAIVATAGTPMVDLAGATILLPEVDEESVVQTRFATTTLALLRAHLGESLEAAASDAQEVLDAPAADLLGELADVDQITFLGRGWTNGLAEEAALKLRESAQLWTEAYPAMEYRHGPISIAQKGRAVWAFGEVPAGLAEDIAATGAHFEHADRDPLADLVRVHLLCEYAASKRGLNPDQPRNLTRSIILEPSEVPQA